MAINKVATGWQADFFPEGRAGKRIRKTFKKKVDAQNFEADEKAKARQGEYTAPPKKDHRRLSDICDSWHKLHGNTLTTGSQRLTILKKICRALDDPFARNIDKLQFIEYRDQRLGSGITANHLNHELTYLKACFNVLIKLEDWKLSNPFQNITKLKVKKKRLGFLSLEEIERLLLALEDARNPDVLIITRICLETGCRWGEAQELDGQDIHNGRIHFIDTKNGLNRSVPIGKNLEIDIFEGRARRGILFCSAWEAFNNGVERAKITLPKGQKTHVLRLSYASHFVMDGGSIMDLRKILGHENIQMTMIYADLSPEHLEDSVKRNPLKQIERKRNKTA
ncbi:MAG: tyrosine-type recombinase/integrase [Pseudomonadales bacterium]|nr:tyrosine-type recombinase/integrase [Pseudomonadales bacterium]